MQKYTGCLLRGVRNKKALVSPEPKFPTQIEEKKQFKKKS